MSNVTLRAQHPDYVGSSNNFAADVAVLTLDRAVTLNQYVAIAHAGSCRFQLGGQRNVDQWLGQSL
jgi:urease beta subunit